MQRLPAVLLLVVIVLIAGTSASIQAQNGGAPARGAAPMPEALPQRTAKAFAPFMRAILTRRFNIAQQIFKVRRSVLNGLEQPDEMRTLSRFQKPDALDLNLIGGRMLGRNIGILLFTIANEEGPVYFKIYYYGVGDEIYIDRMDIGDDWDDLENLDEHINQLSEPVTVPMAAVPDEGGGQ